MTTSLKSIFSKIIYILLTCFILTRCEEKQELPKVLKPIDLTRELKFSKVEKFLFNEKKELVSHWKKNPGRFSELEQKNKWLNTQATFNTDKIFFYKSLTGFNFTFSQFQRGISVRRWSIYSSVRCRNSFRKWRSGRKISRRTRWSVESRKFNFTGKY